MLTSKERADLRAQSNALDTTLMVGKGGVTESVIAEAENQLTARELVKGKVLEGALMSPREVSDAICQATGAEGVAVGAAVGSVVGSTVGIAVGSTVGSTAGVSVGETSGSPVGSEDGSPVSTSDEVSGSCAYAAGNSAADSSSASNMAINF